MYFEFRIRDRPPDLFISYLKNIYQCTYVRISMSSRTKVSCRLPQGSCLGLLFYCTLMTSGWFPILTPHYLLMILTWRWLIKIWKVGKQNSNKTQKGNSWFCQNKLFLKFWNTNHMMINKQFLIKYQCNFRITLDIFINWTTLSNTLGCV